MTDISIGNVQNGDNNFNRNGECSKLEKLEKRYAQFKEKAEKSDLANAPTLKRRELELVRQIKAAAIEAGDDKKVEQYTLIEEGINAALNPEPQRVEFGYYQPIINAPTHHEAEEVDEGSAGSQQIREIYPNLDDEYHVNEIIRKTTNFEGVIAPETIDAIKMLAGAGVKSSVTSMLSEEFERYDEDFGGVVIDIDKCKTFTDIKSKGMEDIDALAFTKMLDKGFEDNGMTISLAKKMKSAAISTAATIDIIDKLSIAGDKGLKKITPEGGNSVIVLKNLLVKTRNNERLERENPINHRGVQSFAGNEMTIVLKDGEIIYSTPIEGEDSKQMSAEKKDITQVLEDKTLSEFVEKYKTADGRLDAKALRTMTALRNYGVTYGSLFTLMDECVGENGIDNDKLAVIGKLKGAGALSCDVKVMLDAFDRDENGKINKEQVETACNLSKNLLKGEEITRILPLYDENPHEKDFINFFTETFVNDVSKILDLVDMTHETGEYDENAAEIIYDLYENNNEEQFKNISINDFVRAAKQVIDAAKDKETGKVDSEAQNIVTLMCSNNESLDRIMQALDVCRDEVGAVSEDLAEIFWNTYNLHNDYEQAEKVVQSCKNDDNSIDFNAVSYTREKLTQGTFENEDS